MIRPNLLRGMAIPAVALLAVGCAAPGASLSPSLPSATIVATEAPSTPGPTQPVATTIPTSPPSPTIEPTDAPPPAAWPAVPDPPTPDAAGTLLVMHVRWSDTGGPGPMLVVLADGRVVMPRQDEDGLGGLMQRQLTASGIEFVRAALIDVGLFDRDRTRKLIKPLNCCGAGDQLRVRLADTTVSVGRMLAFPENYEPSGAWDRFDTLVEDLGDLDAWLPAGAWGGPWSPYHAPLFCLGLSSDSPGGAALAADDLAWPAGVRPFASFGVEGWSSDTRVGSIGATDAYALARSIVDQANAAGVANDGGYVVPLEQGGSLRFPAIRAGAIDWLLSLSPRWPRWTDCAGMG